MKHTHHRPTTRALTLSGLAVAALALGACGSADHGSDHGSLPGMGAAPSASATAGTQAGTQTGTDATSAHNDADATFASMMIPHHEQAVTMSEMAAKSASSADVTQLASQIGAAQGPEIETMRGWLTAWDVLPTDDSEMNGMTNSDGSTATGHEGHDMGSDGSMGDMPGMMSADEMTALGRAAGTDFDRMWLEMMVRHHEGAVEMARTETTDGQNADAKALAQQIITSQTAEITRMKALLTQLR
ncbi:DUF305 domain-containing protein [Terracoccus luteus]|uniref:Uncharacterized protein (DUF305 family) n=1 Tax=Terracoccus luteus TaxID=53356 RepID=A0A839Q0Q7_9MICO|nr:DUF305 domain-containing protein [Terracoccus luteus]MBB2986652.1 uncharacterized protein (DUF305 family) [Terracoccus luteus]MCP2171759.1 uncharacterized protein (DUF305 family) [Terracoccus luteus]